MVGNDGVIYEGRGSNIISAAALHWNNLSISIGFMGTYIFQPPTDDAVYATLSFLQYLVDKRK